MGNNVLKRVYIDVKFKQPFGKPPKVKILEPKTLQLIGVQVEGFRAAANLDPLDGGHFLTIQYQANFEQFTAVSYIQFCPVCQIVLETWPTFLPLTPTPGGKTAPALPLGICMKCGAVFVAKRTLNKLKPTEERPLILNPHGGLL